MNFQIATGINEFKIEITENTHMTVILASEFVYYGNYFYIKYALGHVRFT